MPPGEVNDTGLALSGPNSTILLCLIAGQNRKPGTFGVHPWNKK